MNKTVVGIILIVAAIALVAFFAWPRMKPYLAPAPPPAEQAPGEMPI